MTGSDSLLLTPPVVDGFDADSANNGRPFRSALVDVAAVLAAASARARRVPVHARLPAHAPGAAAAERVHVAVVAGGVRGALRRRRRLAAR